MKVHKIITTNVLKNNYNIILSTYEIVGSNIYSIKKCFNSYRLVAPDSVSKTFAKGDPYILIELNKVCGSLNIKLYNCNSAFEYINDLYFEY